MKVTLNWLKQYVDFDWSPEELRERLTMLGIEVEGMQKLGGEFEGIVVAQVITRDKHPNADKLSLCRVNDGKGERQIVCGADNFKAGDKVPLILPGASLPPKPGEKEPFTIKVGKIRGVESHGMLCSPQELGLAADAEGLLILREDAKVGQPFAEYLGRSGGDVVYDLEITPNRPDWNSVVGIAREIAAVTGNELRLPTITLPSIKDDGNPVPSPTASEGVQISGARLALWQREFCVRLEDAELCPRYTARVVRGVKIGPSPDWLRQTLEKIGIRSINNVVDVTNFVMMEIGQPLHAFDYHLIAKGQGGKPTIVVRRAQSGELFVTLDGQKRTLTSEMLLIADEQKGIALAGVMGGQNTEINERTTDVLIESAYFSPTNIRRTSKALGLRSESSYRFERGADIGVCHWANHRAAQLILEIAGGELAEGVVDAYPNSAEMRTVTLRHEKVPELLGVQLKDTEQNDLLRRLGLEFVAFAPAARKRMSAFRIPTFRVDLKREVDLIEEIGRLYGVDKIPSTPPRGAIGANEFDAVHDELAEARRLLSGLGLFEAQGQTLINIGSATRNEFSAPYIVGNIIRLDNPLSMEMTSLRKSLLHGLLDSLKHNVARKNECVSLFEIGRVFARENNETKETRCLAVVLSGQKNPTFWGGSERDAKFDAFDLKGILEEFFEQFGLRGLSYARQLQNTGGFVESALILQGKQTIGVIGQLLPYLARLYDVRDAVFLAELNLDLLLARRAAGKSFRPLPAFPAIRRDVAMVVPEATTHDAVLSVVKQTKPANLETVELFDVFRGKNVPEGQKSLAYAFTYRATDKTLTDGEVNTAHMKIVEAFKTQLNAAVRE